MPFLLAEILNFQGSAHLRGVGSFSKLIRQGKARNVAVAAIARELACFVWGMMTDNISVKAV